jgi:hypothetical protein
MVADLRRALSDEDYDRRAALNRLEARIRSEQGRDEAAPDHYVGLSYQLAFRAYDELISGEGEGTGWWWFKGYPGLVESPARKREMIARGLVDYWFEHGFPPQCRSVGDDDFECD